MANTAIGLTDEEMAQLESDSPKALTDEEMAQLEAQSTTPEPKKPQGDWLSSFADTAKGAIGAVHDVGEAVTGNYARGYTMGVSEVGKSPEQIAESERIKKEYPTTSGVAELAGGVTSPIALGSKALGAVKKGAEYLSPKLAAAYTALVNRGIIKPAAETVKGAISGGIDTAVQEGVTSPTIAEIPERMKEGAIAGSVTGGVLAGAGSAVGETSRALKKIDTSAEPGVLTRPLPPEGVRKPEAVKRELDQTFKKQESNKGKLKGLDLDIEEKQIQLDQHKLRNEVKGNIKDQVRQENLASLDEGLADINSQLSELRGGPLSPTKLNMERAKSSKYKLDLEDLKKKKARMEKANESEEVTTTKVTPVPLEDYTDHLGWANHKIDQLENLSLTKKDPSSTLFARQQYMHRRDSLETAKAIEQDSRSATDIGKELDDLSILFHDKPDEYIRQTGLIPEGVSLSSTQKNELMNKEKSLINQKRKYISNYLSGKSDAYEHTTLLPKLSESEAKYAAQWNGDKEVNTSMLPGAELDLRRVENQIELKQAQIALNRESVELLNSSPERYREKMRDSLEEAKRKLEIKRKLAETPTIQVEDIGQLHRADKLERDRKRLVALKDETTKLLEEIPTAIDKLQQEYGTSDKAYGEFQKEFRAYLEAKNMPKTRKSEIQQLTSQLVPRKVKIAGKLTGMAGEPMERLLRNPGLAREIAVLYTDFSRDREAKKKK